MYKTGSDRMKETQSYRSARRTVWLAIFLMILITLVAIIKSLELSKTTEFSQNVVAPKGNIAVAIADDAEEREKGLMYKDGLDVNSGMLFIFEKDLAGCFWMKNTKIPLDIIWLDESKKVIFIREHANPYDETSICADKTATYVLEVNAGQAKEYGIVLGAELAF